MKPASTPVTETALITLKARALESQRACPLLNDPMAVWCLERLESQLSMKSRSPVLRRSLPRALTRHIALRSRKYDNLTRTFLADRPNGLVVSLGAGFDTRYWRVQPGSSAYVEVDLPEVVESKRAILEGRADYEMIGCSVTEAGWLQAVSGRQKEEVLFLAEGLLMYLPRSEAESLLRRLAAAFTRSEMVFEVVHERYTDGWWKRVVEAKMRRSLGTEAGRVYQFGVPDARSVESLAPEITVLEEWSYFEDPELRPRLLRILRHWDFVARTQWTIRAALG